MAGGNGTNTRGNASQDFNYLMRSANPGISGLFAPYGSTSDAIIGTGLPLKNSMPSLTAAVPLASYMTADHFGRLFVPLTATVATASAQCKRTARTMTANVVSVAAYTKTILKSLSYKSATPIALRNSPFTDTTTASMVASITSPAVGNYLVITVESHSAGVITDIAFPAGWVLIHRIGSSSVTTAAAWYLYISGTGTGTPPSSVTMTHNQSDATWSGMVNEISGLDPSNPIDQQTITTQSTSAGKTTSSLTPSQKTSDKALMMAWASDLTAASVPSLSISTGETVLQNSSSIGSLNISSAVGLVNSQAARTATGTPPGSSTALSVAFIIFTPTYVPANVFVASAGSVKKSAQKSFNASVTVASRFWSYIYKIASVTFTTAFTAIKTGGGTVYTQALTAAVSTAAAQLKNTSRSLSATITDAGTFAKTSLRSFAAGVTISGTFFKKVIRGLTATLTDAGTTAKVVARSFTASVSDSGTFAKTILKNLTATITTSGAMQRFIRALLTASATVSAGLAAAKSGGGTVYTQSLTAAVATVGVFKKLSQRSFNAAQMTFSATIKKSSARLITAAQTTTGNFTKSIGRIFTATTTRTGSFFKQAGKNLTAAVAQSGVVNRLTSNVMTAQFTDSSSLTRRVARALTASVTTAGQTAKTALKNLTAHVASAGTVTSSKLHLVFLTASVAVSGTFHKTIGRPLTAAITPTVSFTRRIARNLVAVLTTVGILPAGKPRNKTFDTVVLVRHFTADALGFDRVMAFQTELLDRHPVFPQVVLERDFDFDPTTLERYFTLERTVLT